LIAAQNDSPLSSLTARQTEVVELVAKGFTNAEIAQLLKVSISTVKFHLRAVFAVLGASARTEAVSTYLAYKGPDDEPRAASDRTAPPRIAVLSFDDWSARRTRDDFCGALVREVITRLSLQRLVPVLSLGTAQSHWRGCPDPVRLGQDLGVSYLVTGSVRRSREHCVAQTHLLDAATGVHLWDGEFRARTRNGAGLLEAIAHGVVASLIPRMIHIERRRVAERDRRTYGAWEFAVLGCWHLERTSRCDNEKARGLFESALEYDPWLVLPHYGIAMSHYNDLMQQWTRDAWASHRGLVQASQAALDIDPSDFRAHTASGFAWMVSRDYDRAIAALRSAIENNPGAVRARILLAQILALRHQISDAVRLLSETVRLTLQDPTRWRVHAALALIQFSAKDYDSAVRSARHAQLGAPLDVPLAALIVSALSLLGHEDEATREAKQLLARFPAFHSERWDVLLRHVSARDRARFLEGLRHAGLSKCGCGRR